MAPKLFCVLFDPLEDWPGILAPRLVLLVFLRPSRGLGSDSGSQIVFCFLGPSRGLAPKLFFFLF